MDEQTFTDLFGAQIVLTEAVRDVVIRIKHPDIAPHVELIPLALAEPDEICRSKTDTRSVIYLRYFPLLLNGKWLVVVMKRIDRNFISTFYASDKKKEGELLWKRP